MNEVRSLPPNDVLSIIDDIVSTFTIDKEMVTSSFSHTKCICGNILTKVDEKDVVTQPGIFGFECDICHKSNSDDEQDTFWKCDDEYNIFHPDGYDHICDNCALNGPQKITGISSVENDVVFTRDESDIKQYDVYQCKDNKDCKILQEFLEFLMKYNKHCEEISKDIDNSKLLQIVNDYLHLLHEHDNDDQFTYIVDKLGECDVSQCKLFSRNYIKRMNNTETYECNVAYSVIDKIHCYFQHCYDTGNRLSPEDQGQLDKSMNDEKDSGNTFDRYAINQRIIAMKKILIIKQKQNVINLNSTLIRNKYNQLFTEKEHNLHKQNTDVDNTPVYSFGYSFKYGYDDERFNDDEYIDVTNKYKSFKEELTQNNINNIAIEQYNIEYAKANIHFGSYFCAKTYKSIQNNSFAFLIEYILALMIYCNYDKLQCEFSKTYRDNEGKYHNQFYFLGKYIKICVHIFGMKASKGVIRAFYHGVSEMMYLPSYFKFGEPWIKIYCPVSTTSSFEVSANFATINGLIIQFAVTDDIDNDYDTYFSCSWLSDYPNEKEYLFVQNSAGVVVVDICEFGSGLKYGIVLQSLWIFGELLEGHFINSYEQCQALVDSILSHQLSLRFSEYESFKSLTHFAQQMINSYLQTIQELSIDYWQWRYYLNSLSKLFFNFEMEWIKLEVISTLLPNLTSIEVKKLKLSIVILNDILQYMQSVNKQYIEISITRIKKKSSLSIEQAINQYSDKFMKVGAFIFGNLYSRELYIGKYDKLVFLNKIFYPMNSVYFNNKNIQRLIENRYKKNCNADIEQQSFNNHCDQMKEIQIYWNSFASNTESYLYSLIHHSEQKWIKIGRILCLFPNIETFDLNYIGLSCFVFDDVLLHLKNNQSKIHEMEFYFPNEEKMSMDAAISQYKEKFETINCTIKIVANKMVLPTPWIRIIRINK